MKKAFSLTFLFLCLTVGSSQVGNAQCMSETVGIGPSHNSSHAVGIDLEAGNRKEVMADGNQLQGYDGNLADFSITRSNLIRFSSTNQLVRFVIQK